MNETAVISTLIAKMVFSCNPSSFTPVSRDILFLKSGSDEQDSQDEQHVAFESSRRVLFCVVSHVSLRQSVCRKEGGCDEKFAENSQFKLQFVFPKNPKEQSYSKKYVFLIIITLFQS